MRVRFKDVEYNTASRGVIGSVKFERQFGIAYAEAFTEGATPRMEWMAYLAYTELVGEKVEVGAFDDDFLAGLDFLPPTDEETSAAAAGVPVAEAAPLVPEVQPG